jgi:hypothetical protein
VLGSGGTHTTHLLFAAAEEDFFCLWWWMGERETIYMVKCSKVVLNIPSIQAYALKESIKFTRLSRDCADSRLQIVKVPSIE